MLQLIHAHDVMNMMIESRASYTRESFKLALADNFGENAQFHTCSLQGLTSDDLLSFLFQRGKLSGEIEGEFRMEPLNMCSH